MIEFQKTIQISTIKPNCINYTESIEDYRPKHLIICIYLSDYIFNDYGDVRRSFIVHPSQLANKYNNQ